MTTDCKNLDSSTIDLITGRRKNKIPVWKGLYSAMLFEKQIAINRIKEKKKTLSPFKRQETFLKYSGYLVKHCPKHNIFKKTDKEKQELKNCKKSWRAKVVKRELELQKQQNFTKK